MSPLSLQARAAWAREVLRIRVPILQAPMAGVTTPRLVSAASAAGALGCHGAAFLTPTQLRADIASIRRALPAADTPFCVNLFATDYAQEDAASAARATAALAPFYEEAGLPLPVLDAATRPTPFEALFAVCVEERVPVLSFTFGRLTPSQTRAAKEAGCVLLGTATCVREAVLLAGDGVDAVVAQGAEAGGHRGSFGGGDGDGSAFPLVGTMALVPQVAGAVSVPVLAAGGVASAEGVAAALTLGARAVCVGTGFIPSADCEAPEVLKDAVCGAPDDATLVTDVFSGRPARGIRNRLSDALQAAEAGSVAEYPQQMRLSNPLKKSGVADGRVDVGSVWCGQASQLAAKYRGAPAKEIVDSLSALCV